MQRLLHEINVNEVLLNRYLIIRFFMSPSTIRVNGVNATYDITLTGLDSHRAIRTHVRVKTPSM